MAIKYPRIRISRAKKFFGSYNQLAQALGINRASVSEWLSRGLIYLPETQAWRLSNAYPEDFGNTIPTQRPLNKKADVVESARG